MKMRKKALLRKAPTAWSKMTFRMRFLYDVPLLLWFSFTEAVTDVGKADSRRSCHRMFGGAATRA